MSYNKVLVFEQSDMSFTTINDLLTGANIAGFEKIAEAMIMQGI